MGDEVSRLARQLGVKVFYSMDLACDGFYISEMNTIVLNTKISSERQYLTMLHELGHSSYHQGYETLYRATTAAHLKFEAEANEYAARRCFESYLDSLEDNVPALNIVDFIEYWGFNIDWIPKFENWLSEYLEQQEIS